LRVWKEQTDHFCGQQTKKTGQRLLSAHMLKPQPLPIHQCSYRLSTAVRHVETSAHGVAERSVIS